MSIEANREYGKIISFALTCDGCGYGEDIEVTVFEEAKEAAKDMGWALRKRPHTKRVTTTWMNICPDCIELEREGEKPAAGVAA